MATKSIAWNTGSGNITLTYQGQGDGPISIQSDTNNLGSVRSQVITIETVGGAIIRNFTVSQAACPVPVGTVLNYTYTGSYQEVTLPAGQYKLQCWGAQGGSNGTNSTYSITAKAGGKGGYSEGVLTLSQKTTVRVYVGGKGSASAGGFNGGGSTTGTSQYNASNELGYSKMGGGGGATDIRLSDGELLSRMIVAGGGSGGAMAYRSKTTTTTKSVTLASGSVTPKGWTGNVTPTSGPYTEDGHTFYQAVVRDFTLYANHAYNLICSGDLYSYFFTQNNGSQSLGTFVQKLSSNRTDIWIVLRSNTSSNVGWSIEDRDYTGTYGIRRGYYYNISKYQSVVESFSFYKNHTYTLSVSGSGVSEYYLSQGGTTNSGHTTGKLSADSSNWFVVVRTTGTSTFTWTITDSYEETTTTTNNYSQVGFVGGGATGGGYSDAYKGKQNAAGTNGSFGQGANQTAANYRYCSGAGGGGWYGGGGGQKSDSTTSYVNQSGGGSGFVNTAANAQYRPTGYNSLQLDSGETKDGATSFPNTAGSGNETGHSGNGYAKITRLA